MFLVRSLAVLLLMTAVAWGQSQPTPPFTDNVTLSASQLNAAFAAKADYPLPISKIASGSLALATTAIASATCSSTQVVAASGVLATDVVSVSFNGDPTAMTGYMPATTGMLTIIPFLGANTVNVKVCNNTSASITPGAITINWRVAR